MNDVRYNFPVRSLVSGQPYFYLVPSQVIKRTDCTGQTLIVLSDKQRLFAVDGFKFYGACRTRPPEAVILRLLITAAGILLYLIKHSSSESCYCTGVTKRRCFSLQVQTIRYKWHSCRKNCANVTTSVNSLNLSSGLIRNSVSIRIYNCYNFPYVFV